MWRNAVGCVHSLTALGNIPCTIRDSLKHVAGRSFNFKADGNMYVLDVYRGHNTTVMGGNDWVKFVTDFNLGAGSYVVFDTSKRTAEAYVVHLGFGDFANDGESDEDVEGEGARVEVFNIESDEDDHEEGDAQEVVYTQGCVLSGVEESLLDVVLANNDGTPGTLLCTPETLFPLFEIGIRRERHKGSKHHGAGLSKLQVASLGGEAMEDGDGEQPYQLLQSKLRKILDTKETREIVRQKTLKRPRSSNELEDKPNNGVVPKAYNRCSVPYFVDVVKTTLKSQSKVDLVKGIGFAYLLELDDSVVPRHFTQWVADKVKNESETCYGQENHQWASTKRYSYLKAAIERTVGDTLNEKVKEDIYLSFQQHMREEGPNTCSKVKNLILEVIQIVTRATCDSEKTLKIDSSANQHNSTNHGHDSEATVKVNSNGEYEEEDEDEQQALTDNGSSDWARYLDEARQKYFFYSDNVQTIRLFENQDDSGTKINEPELWRPLGMSSKEYENKIQVAKNNGPRKSNEQAKRSSNKLNVPCDWARYLDEAREKYFFYTDDIPTLRLFENEDDNGTEITEQEPWRPLGMSSEEYEKKIQMAKNNGPHKRTKEADNIDFNASPELQILGERSLQENCLNMLGTSDEHYNTSLLLGSTSSSIGKENVPTKRIVQPSRYLCSPYDNKDRGSLMIHEIEPYNNLVILSRSADFKGRWVVEIDNTRVSMEQLGNSFREKGWVESYVINVFCRKLFRDNHPRTSQRHFFFHTASEYFLQKWKNEASRLQWRDRLIKSFIGAGKARDLQLCNELFFPTIHRSHWFVFLVDLSARKFIFLDSKYDGEHTFHKEIKQMMVENFKQLWNAAGLRNMGFRHYEIAYPNLPKQDGDDACGIFVLKWLENWRSRNSMQTVFRQEDVHDACIRLAIDILFSQHNILTEGKRIVKDF
ncbi:hypothetical protein D1007_34700 [Hordeum vulgare]|nr:hypothetical protein D1007_34700 [Hordeum vulgare]